MKLSDLNYNAKEIEEILKSGAKFMGVSCSRCHTNINVTDSISGLVCKCKSHITIPKKHIQEPFVSPDYGPSASLISFSENYNVDQVQGFGSSSAITQDITLELSTDDVLRRLKGAVHQGKLKYDQLLSECSSDGPSVSVSPELDHHTINEHRSYYKTYVRLQVRDMKSYIATEIEQLGKMQDKIPEDPICVNEIQEIINEYRKCNVKLQNIRERVAK